MPLYLCNSRPGSVPEAAKAKIADDITRIHCEITNAPPTFVHVFFFEDDANTPVDAGAPSISLHGNIRKGRTQEQRQQLVLEMRQAANAHTGIAMDDIAMTAAEIPASWVMEGGDILPEPGEEEAWLKAHEAKVNQEQRA